MDCRLHRLLPALAILVLLPREAAGCPICLGAVESPLLDAAQIGVFAMVSVTIGVLAGFAAWFVRLARRDEAIQQERDTP